MRVDGWETRLMEAVQRHDSMPLEYGTSDCIIHIADCIEAVTGEDPMASYRGAYASEEEAGELLVSLGASDVEELLESLYEEVPPALARRGDVGVVKIKGVAACVVVMGPLIIGKSSLGSIKMSTSRLTRAFKIE